MDFCRYVRSLYPAEVRLHFVLDNFSAHKGPAGPRPGPRQQRRARLHAPDHATQARLIRRYIAWRNRHADDPKLRRLVNMANVA